MKVLFPKDPCLKWEAGQHAVGVRMESKEEILESLLDGAEERVREELGEKYARPARLLEKRMIIGESAFFEFWNSLQSLDEDELKMFIAFLGGRLRYFYRGDFDFSDEALERAGRIRKVQEESGEA
ncbi:hypothetical protein AKJ51_01620 [candidate division MSBL1 archaeon SCGC-AAA382A20]|uniref:Uncharacterized protein n=1 Tax=candidate division MSBL1 archaeon SCGC-AAA382A20 TaxID=1698280 RepID=A0A133VLG6_9EURY|nr:hypothetical protein AKJ51_01620 [candidate division MSBL1 archaeon SCGC-AAA382A20]